MFNGGFPVVLSSGRSAIFVASKLFWRKNIIFVFPYASQCVVMALQKAGLTVATKIDFSSDILIDQWGILDKECNRQLFIEDSSDTFLQIGSKVLELDADFEVWSLPKIIGSRFGAVLWCREEESAIKIRQARDENSDEKKYFKKLMRFMRNVNISSYKAWENLEFHNLGLTDYEYGTILKNMGRWEKIYDIRKAKFQKALRTLELNTQNDFTDNSKTTWNRIPAIIYTKKISSLERLNKYRFSRSLHRVKYGVQPEKVQIYNYMREF
jgi:putative PLP-dependent aminotransferase (TIGR04422 family)